MLTSSGLRQRRASIAVVKETPATVEKRSSTCSNSRLLLSRFVPIEVGGGGSGGWSSRKYSTFTMLAAMVLGLFVGILVGSWYTVAAIGSIKYPRVEKFVMKFSALQGLHFKVDAWGGNDENGEHGEGNGEEEEEEDDEESVISCTKDQPLVEIANSALDAGVFKQMQDCLIGHPMITKNHLNPDGFSGTRGFVIKFANDVGAARFENETQFSCSGFNPLLPFFERARHPKANAFVMNVLVCDKPENTTELVVGTHVDDTLGHTKPNVNFLAHTVSVLYLSVPDDMTGGELEILGNEEQAFGEAGFDGEVEKTLPAIKTIRPVENSFAQFRGDSYHRVRGYGTATSRQRVSLVLEQYSIAEENERFLLEYEQSEKNGMTMM